VGRKLTLELSGLARGSGSAAHLWNPAGLSVSPSGNQKSVPSKHASHALCQVPEPRHSPARPLSPGGHCTGFQKIKVN
jgi:hypothetical protein